MLCRGNVLRLRIVRADMVSRRTNKTSIGFGGKVHKLNVSEDDGERALLQQVEPQDLQVYGMVPEFVGRFPMLVTTEELSVNQLVDVLTRPKNALVKQYTRLYLADDVDLQFTPGALQLIAECKCCCLLFMVLNSPVFVCSSGKGEKDWSTRASIYPRVGTC